MLSVGDGDAVAHGALGEDRVVDLAEGEDGAGDGARDAEVLLLGGKRLVVLGRGGVGVRLLLRGRCLGGDVGEADEEHAHDGTEEGDEAADDLTSEGVGAGLVGIHDGQRAGEAGVDVLEGTEQGDHDGADRTGDAAHDERLLQAQRDTVDGGLGDAEDTGEGCGGRDLLHLHAAGLEEHAEGGADLGNDRGGLECLEKVRAVLGEVGHDHGGNPQWTPKMTMT